MTAFFRLRPTLGGFLVTCVSKLIGIVASIYGNATALAI